MMKNNTRGGCAAKKGMSFSQYFPVPIFFFFFFFFFAIQFSLLRISLMCSNNITVSNNNKHPKDYLWL